MTCAAGEWEACGDRFYERHELYTMSWSDVRLDQMRQVSCANLLRKGRENNPCYSATGQRPHMSQMMHLGPHHLNRAPAAGEMSTAQRTLLPFLPVLLFPLRAQPRHSFRGCIAICTPQSEPCKPA